MKNYSIVGMDHQGTTDIVAALQPGVTVTLVREPENKFDKNAIAVWSGGKRIGYIPSKQNAGLAAAMDQGAHGYDSAKLLAMDQKPDARAMDATFVRSANSGWPMVSA